MFVLWIVLSLHTARYPIFHAILIPLSYTHIHTDARRAYTSYHSAIASMFRDSRALLPLPSPASHSFIRSCGRVRDIPHSIHLVKMIHAHWQRVNNNRINVYRSMPGLPRRRTCYATDPRKIWPLLLSFSIQLPPRFLHRCPISHPRRDLANTAQSHFYCNSGLERGDIIREGKKRNSDIHPRPPIPLHTNVTIPNFFYLFYYVYTFPFHFYERNFLNRRRL